MRPLSPSLKAIAPVALAILLALLPAPAGLALHAWRYFAIFAGVILGLVLNPLPGAALGFLGVTTVAALARFVLFSPEQLAAPGFRPANAAIAWALSGFSDSTVWLIFGAYMFALGYEKTGLGRRIALLLVKWMGGRTLTLGYAIALADVALAPFTPSNTARSGGVIYPVIRHLPKLYDSHPNDPSARRIGSYLMWVAIAVVSITSTTFLTGLAPNLLAVEIARRTLHIEIAWGDWFRAAAPVGLLLLLVTPALAYWIYPPTVKKGGPAQAWAVQELANLGGLKRNEITLMSLVTLALGLWVFAGDSVSPTTVALIVISLMLLTGVFSWSDVAANAQAWSTLAWFATLVALADGLSRVGFVAWFAKTVASHLGGVEPLTAMIVLLAVFFFAHYLFASLTAHAAALMPVMLAAGAGIPGLPVAQFAILLCLELGIMGVLTPYATGPSPIYQSSGYLPPSDSWRLGLIFGCVFFGVLIAVGIPWTSFLFGTAAN